MTDVKTIKIDDVEYVRADSLQQLSVKTGESLYRLGLKVFIRTVTYHYVGQISFVSGNELVLTNASWVASSGRFGAALKTGSLDEVEVYPGPVSINVASIVDISPWNHILPTESR